MDEPARPVRYELRVRGPLSEAVPTQIEALGLELLEVRRQRA